MNTTVINIKTDPKLKKNVQTIANKLGFSLSSIINAYLKQLVRTKTVVFSILNDEPTDYLINALKESEEDRKSRKKSRSFDNAEDAIAWLHDSNRKYAN